MQISQNRDAVNSVNNRSMIVPARTAASSTRLSAQHYYQENNSPSASELKTTQSQTKHFLTKREANAYNRNNELSVVNERDQTNEGAALTSESEARGARAVDARAARSSASAAMIDHQHTSHIARSIQSRNHTPTASEETEVNTFASAASRDAKCEHTRKCVRSQTASQCARALLTLRSASRRRAFDFLASNMSQGQTNDIHYTYKHTKRPAAIVRSGTCERERRRLNRQALSVSRLDAHRRRVVDFVLAIRQVEMYKITNARLLTL